MKLLKLFLFASLIPLVGCASLVSNDPEMVTISSNPPQADLNICNERTGQCIVTGKTPYTLSLETSQGFFKPAHYSIKCNKIGYNEVTQPLHADLDEWYFGNILFGGLLGMLIVDPATGAMWEIEDKNVVINLPKANTISLLPEEIRNGEFLIRGKSTMDSIRGNIGEPADVESPGRGYNYWGYYYDTEPKKLVLKFDDKGVLNDYTEKDI